MEPSPALSIQRNAKATLEGRKIGVLIADGSDAKALKAVRAGGGKAGRRSVRGFAARPQR